MIVGQMTREIRRRRTRHIVVTDRAILIVRPEHWAAVPTLLARLPRDAPIGPLSPLWGFASMFGKTTLHGERLWVPKRYEPAVAYTDGGLADNAEPRRARGRADRHPSKPHHRSRRSRQH